MQRAPQSVLALVPAHARFVVLELTSPAHDPRLALVALRDGVDMTRAVIGLGLVFVAYGASLQPFEQVLHRMLGLEDGVVDALFQFTKPRSGGHYFCPPVHAGKLDLSVLGLV